MPDDDVFSPNRAKQPRHPRTSPTLDQITERVREDDGERPRSGSGLSGDDALTCRIMRSTLKVMIFRN